MTTPPGPQYPHYGPPGQWPQPAMPPPAYPAAPAAPPAYPAPQPGYAPPQPGYAPAPGQPVRQPGYQGQPAPPAAPGQHAQPYPPPAQAGHARVYAAAPPSQHQFASPNGGQPGWPGQPMHAPSPQPAPGWGAPPGQPVIIDVGKATGKRLIVASIVAGALGLVAICAGLTGAVEGGIGVAITAIVIGAVFLLIGLLPLLMRKKVFRPRRLVIEQPGIRWDDPQDKPWAVPWRELSAVSISKHGALQVGPESVSDKISGAIVDRTLGERVHVRLDLFPADPGFHQRHPEMAHLWAKDRYRLPFGQNPWLIPQLDAALRQFQPGLYRGVQETEGFMGLR